MGKPTFADKLIDEAGDGFIFGLGWVSCRSLVKAFQQQPKGSKNRFIKCLRAAWEINRAAVPRDAGFFASYFILFEGVEYGVGEIKNLRGLVVCGAITGYLTGIRRGFRHATRTGIYDALLFGGCGLAHLVITRRYRSDYFQTKEEKEKEKEKKKKKNMKMIPALAACEQPMHTAKGIGALYACFEPKEERNSKTIPALASFKQPMPMRNKLISDTPQGFGGLYASPEPKEEKNSEMIRALAALKQPMQMRNRLNSDTVQGFGGLYACQEPKVRPYFSSGINMDSSSKFPKDKGI